MKKMKNISDNLKKCQVLVLSFLALSSLFLFKAAEVEADDCSDIPEIEKEALQVIYNEMRGDLEYNIGTKWSTDENGKLDFSDLNGITIKNNQVYDITLRDINLSGSIPSEISNFKNLHKIFYRLGYPFWFGG